MMMVMTTTTKNACSVGWLWLPVCSRKPTATGRVEGERKIYKCDDNIPAAQHTKTRLSREQRNPHCAPLLLSSSSPAGHIFIPCAHVLPTYDVPTYKYFAAQDVVGGMVVVVTIVVVVTHVNISGFAAEP